MTLLTSNQAHQAEQVLKAHGLSRVHIHSAAVLLSEVMQNDCTTQSNTLPDTSLAVPCESVTGSGRRRLWDMGHSAACPVTGVCLDLPELQKLARKSGLSVDGCSDYEVHSLVLQACRSRSALAEQLQRELDRRYARQIQQSHRFKTTEALAEGWTHTSLGSDWAGDFWALLTHPHCSADLENQVLGQVHMLQHQMGLAARADITRLNEVLAHNQCLIQELAAARQRLQAQAAEQAATLDALRTECNQLRARLIRAEAARSLAPSEAVAAQGSDIASLSRQRQAEGKQRLADHNEKLLMRKLRREAEAQANAVRPGKPDRTSIETEAAKGATFDTSPPSTVDLTDRAVLCVGGRTQGIPIYRQVIENRGARFMHHDGGEEDKASRLGNQLQAADVVICQVACISHGAYWRVKEHCKRTGKPCLFVEMPSRSALERALGQLASRVLGSLA
ncbi:DUF2325 domain-containing protein [Rhodoferax sp. U11-2br]|uniref:DUF2325 domain-containing protein n=1 Tax=Rhodoferax sp. U11-2br TaxID=2838878 RepID=UPI001BEB3CEF|nr:DUF2325 domain-containing protein [Rhodoferax sp. U11-2br]MBT3065605.1 DUF2325 domain-containing protein [Rhodoferax sp. U11-2br]